MPQVPFSQYFHLCAGRRQHGSPLRLFHGPGEGRNAAERALAVERLGDLLWIHAWETPSLGFEKLKPLIEDIRTYALQQKIPSVVLQRRPLKGPSELPEVLAGPSQVPPFAVKEDGATFEIRVENSRHPGLFLDHAPLRHWLRTSPRVEGARTLNLFAYTGALSIAAAQGGAPEVWTLDLSKPTIDWARRNWELSGLRARSEFRACDVMTELPRLAKRGERFGLVLSDPPSFSRGPKGTFSTQKDLAKLHELILSVLEPGGVVASSINSENVSWRKFEESLLSASQRAGRKVQLLRRIDQPESFPSPLEDLDSRHLKGWVFQAD